MTKLAKVERALVLGGGGAIGVAWETGVLYGLREGGFDPCGVDVVVGTSAGAITGAHVAAGRLPPGLAEGADAVQEASRLPVDPQRLDPKVLGAVFARWAKMELTTREDCAAIGALAASVYRDAEAALVEHIGKLVALASWPDKPLLVNTVDTATGERRVLDRDSALPIGRAVAASAAVPGLFPSVELDGRLYMDGQVHSSTNADVLLPLSPAQVLIAMPTNGVSSPGIGGHAERMLRQEVDALTAAGARVLVRMPREQDGARLGRNLMDVSRVPDAYAVGYETGVSWAAELR